MDEEKDVPRHYYNSDDRKIVDIHGDVFISISIIYDLFKDYCEDSNESGIHKDVDTYFYERRDNKELYFGTI